MTIHKVPPEIQRLVRVGALFRHLCTGHFCHSLITDDRIGDFRTSGLRRMFRSPL